MEGKGYFCCLGKRVAQTRSEIIKGDPEAALSGLVGCGYLGCKATFFQAVQCYNEDYPQILRCKNRTTKHDVAWMEDDKGCKDHYETPPKVTFNDDTLIFSHVALEKCAEKVLLESH